MFKALKDDKIIAINETGEFPCLVHDSVEEDTEHSVADYIQVNGEYVLTSSTEAIEQKKEDVRAVRNSYLETYVDPKQLVMVWNSLTAEEQELYKDYRQYLLDYPQTEGWYEQNPLTFDEWKQSVEESNSSDSVLYEASENKGQSESETKEVI